MNILHIVETFNLSGRSRVIEQLCAALSAEGHKSIVLALSESSYGEDCPDVKVLTLNNEQRSYWQVVSRTLKIVKEERIEIIHSHGKSGLFYGLLIKIFNNKLRFLHSAHRSSGEEVRKNVIFNFFLRSNLDHCVGVSNIVRSNFSLYYKFPGHKTSVIHNGVDPNKFSNPKQVVHKDVFTIGTVANLSKDKDHHTLIRAFNVFHQHHSNSRLIIVGDGPLSDEIRSFARSLNLADSVDFLGRRRDVPGILSAFDIFVLSSKTEGLSVCLLEAMSSGVPVIATNLPAIREIVEHESNGFLFTVGDHKGLSDRLMMLFNDAPLRAKIGQQGLLTVKKNFTEDQMIKKYLSLYATLAN